MPGSFSPDADPPGDLRPPPFCSLASRAVDGAGGHVDLGEVDVLPPPLLFAPKLLLLPSLLSPGAPRCLNTCA